MTHEEAYIEGFCKAAEVAGVDPVGLYKQAQLKARLAGLLGKGVGKAQGAGIRLLELLRGGNRDVMRGLHENAHLDGLLARPLFGANGVFSGAASAGGVAPGDASVARAIRLARVLNPLKRRLNAIRGNGPRAVTVEARKALAAQLGLGTAAAGTAGAAGYGLGKATGGDK